MSYLIFLELFQSILLNYVIFYIFEIYFSWLISSLIYIVLAKLKTKDFTGLRINLYEQTSVSLRVAQQMLVTDKVSDCALHLHVIVLSLTNIKIGLDFFLDQTQLHTVLKRPNLFSCQILQDWQMTKEIHFLAFVSNTIIPCTYTCTS